MLNSSKKILLVEDEIITAMSLEEAIREIGYNSVSIALCPDSAMKLIEKEKYDLTILDINMGSDRDGIDVAKEIRKLRDDAPIIFLTGNSDNTTVGRAKEIEPSAYLIKPFNIKDIEINLELAFHKQEKLSRSYKTMDELGFSRSFINNLPNFVIRVDNTGKILYVNSMIKRLTGKEPVFYSDKTIHDADFDPSIVNIINQCFETCEQKKRKTTLETDLATIMGDRMMQLIAVPERFIDAKLQSIVILIQDITDQKIAVEDLRQRNKKITDSINYSEKIQKALIADASAIKQLVPNSGIFYRPKDTVSGDFPFAIKKNNYVYLAAVDCTGHGVPGALMSIIIHFLLNEIIKLNNNITPAKLLDVLHVFTRKTLKQHLPGINSNDGADVAICRIDTISKEIIYAGAHRPLLYCSNGEVTEVKGDVRSIGGDQLSRKKKRLPFKDNFLNLDSDSKFVIFSDGVTDQFSSGGKGKFGKQNIVEVLQKSIELDCDLTINELEKAFDSWRMGEKQIDDALLICFSTGGF